LDGAAVVKQRRNHADHLGANVENAWIEIGRRPPYEAAGAGRNRGQVRAVAVHGIGIRIDKEANRRIAALRAARREDDRYRRADRDHALRRRQENLHERPLSHDHRAEGVRNVLALIGGDHASTDVVGARRRVDRDGPFAVHHRARRVGPRGDHKLVAVELVIDVVKE